MADLNVALILRFVDQATRPARAAMAQVEGMAGAGMRIAREQMERQRENMALEAAALAGVGYAAHRALGPAIAFEATMAEVGKVVDFEAPDGLKALGRDIQALVTSGGLPMAADGIADIVAAAAGGGLVDQALPDAEKRAELIAFAEAAARMGVAFDISAATAGSAMAVWRGSMGLTQAEALSLGDAVNHLSNNIANASAAELTNVIQRQGDVAIAAGLASHEVAALSAALLAGGKGADVSATALKNFTGALTAGEAVTDRQAGVLEKLGFDAVDLAKRMQVDAKGAILDVTAALRGLEDFERGSAIRQLFGEEVLGSVTPLVENADLLRTAFGLVAEEADYAGSMTREYGVIAETTKSRLTVLTNSMAALSVVAGAALLPAFVSLLDAITPMVQVFGDFAAENPVLIQSFAGIGAGLWAVRAAMLAVNLVMMTNPIVAAIAAIAAGALIIYQNWGGVVAFFREKIDAVRAAFDEGLLNGVLKLLSEFNPFRLMLEGAVNLVEYLTGWDLSAIEERIAAAFDFSLFDAGMRLIRSAWDGMLSVLGPMVSSISARLAAIVPDWLRRAWEWVSGGGGGAPAAGGGVPGRALGGPVRAGEIYRWMEEGQELFVPRVDGSVVSSRDLATLRAGGARRGGGGSVTNNIVVHAAAGMSAEDVARAVRREIERMARSRGAELHDGGAYAS